MMNAKAQYSALHEDNLNTLKHVLTVTSLHKYQENGTNLMGDTPLAPKNSSLK